MEEQQGGTNEPPAWEHSPAKQLLRREILEEKVTPEMKPKQVWLRHDVYQQYKLSNFGTNLRNLRTALKEGQEAAAFDSAALARARIVHPVAATTPRGYPRWDGSDAQKLLKHHVEKKLHEKFTPKELREKYTAYQAFPLKVFRDHIQQEVRSRTETSYWLKRKANKNKEQK